MLLWYWEIESQCSTGLNNLVEPNTIFFDVLTPAVDKAVAGLKSLLDINPEESVITLRTHEQRIERFKVFDQAAQTSVCVIYTPLITASMLSLRSKTSLKLGTVPTPTGGMPSMRFGVCELLSGAINRWLETISPTF